jgi:hypothetical protein
MRPDTPEDGGIYGVGVRHFNIGTDLYILHNWWKTNGAKLRKVLEDNCTCAL